MSRTLRGAVAGSLLVLGLGFHTAYAHRDTDISSKRAFRRLWTDSAIAINSYLDYAEPVASVPEGPDPTNMYGETLGERANLQGIKAYEFWRTLRNKPFLQYRAKTSTVAFDDPGRARLLSLGFIALGGISPYLIMWLGLFAAAPVLIWLWMEFAKARWWAAGTIFSILILGSPFFVETLSLSRYAVAFYLVGALLSLVLIVPAIAADAPTVSSSIRRTALAGVFLALCVSCRSSVTLMAPGFVAAVAMTAHRLPLSSRARLGSFALMAAILLTPALVMRAETHHDMWPPIWEGLGDFDRTYDHAWNDKNAQDFAVSKGYDPELDFQLPQAEPIFRKAVMDHVTSDPLWYATILTKRLLSTISLWKLSPFTPINGPFLVRKTTDNEGMIDKYFTYTIPADDFGIALVPG